MPTIASTDQKVAAILQYLEDINRTMIEYAFQGLSYSGTAANTHLRATGVEIPLGHQITSYAIYGIETNGQY